MHNYTPDVIVFVETWLTNYTLDVIVLVETRLTLNNKDNASIQGYVLKHIVRENSLSEGVSIFYKESLDVNRVDELCLFNLKIELCSINFEIEKNSTVYRNLPSTFRVS